MNLDHIVTLEGFKQRISVLISCGDADSSLELNEIFNRFNHGRKLQKSKSGSRSDQLKKLLIKSVKHVKRYKQPLTIENIIKGMKHFHYDDDGCLIFERIEYDEEKMEEYIYWWQSNGVEKATPVSRIRDRLQRMGFEVVNPD